MKIPLAKPSFSDREMQLVKEVLDSGWVAQGPKVKEFEQAFANYVGAKYALSVNSATSALHCAVESLGITKGDEVIIPDYTFPATGNAVLYAGAKPVIADVCPETFNIEPSKVEELIADRTKAVIPVHTFGNPADMDRIIKIAKKNNLRLIEDAACGHGAEYKNKKAGTFGDVSCFSFHGRKILTTGEGGMITTSNEKIYNKIKKFRSHGMEVGAFEREDVFELPSFETLGYNYRMSDIAAAIGLAQLSKLDRFIAERRELAKYYDKRIKEEKLPLKPQKEQDGAEHVYQSYVVVIQKAGLRDKVIMSLKKKNISSTIGTYSLSKLPLFKGSCPTGNYLFENSIALPMFNGLTKENIDEVIKTLANIFKELK